MQYERIHISKAAKLVGMTPQTLRNWDYAGKLRASRSIGGHRCYTLEQLQPYLVAIDAIGWLWATQSAAPKLRDEYYCERQDRFSSRLDKLGAALLRDQFPESLVSLIALVVGELGDNSFAHNIGRWPNIPGIFFAYDLKRRLIVLADRGQGVFATLRRVRPQLADDRAALRVAFTEIISGRDPEKRGNGLKVVRRVTQTSSIHLSFQSGQARSLLPQKGKRFRIQRATTIVSGSYAVVSWE